MDSLINRFKEKPIPKTYKNVTINIPIITKYTNDYVFEDENEKIEMEKKILNIDTSKFKKKVLQPEIIDQDTLQSIDNYEEYLKYDNVDIEGREDISEEQQLELNKSLSSFRLPDNKLLQREEEEGKIEELQENISEEKDEIQDEIQDKNIEEEKEETIEDNQNQQTIQYIEKLTGQDNIEPTKKGRKKKILENDEETIRIDTDVLPDYTNDIIVQKLPKQDNFFDNKPIISTMNNREEFINYINSFFKKKKYIKLDDAKKSKDDKSLYKNQKIIVDYLNIYSPYRGLLIYHGLGSGKTCASIAVAENFLASASSVSIALTEGIMNPKKIVVLTPKSLRKNYIEQLKECGNKLFRKNQFWEFVPISKDYPVELLSKYLHLDKEYIEKKANPNPSMKKKGGAWMMDVRKSSNYVTLNAKQKKSLDEQLNKMIEEKYEFLSYNGLTTKFKNEIKKKNADNPFDNKVVIIDEAHNFISRIVNKLGKTNKEQINDIDIKVSLKLYEFLMSAQNTRIILLTGTPIINYPNEIAVLFNILRGYIKTFNVMLDKSNLTVTLSDIQKMFSDNFISDYIDLEGNQLIISRNPNGFLNKYKLSDKKYLGVELDTNPIYDYNNDEFFIGEIKKILKSNNLKFDENISIQNYKCLPDTLDEFKNMFINEQDGIEVKNQILMKKRIIGLTSYFKSSSEELMPNIKKINEIIIPMSDHQFKVYQDIRLEERKQESNSKKIKRLTKLQNAYDDKSLSTYRIFSRQFCNFTFPESNKRPMPKDSIEKSVEDTITTCLKDDEFEEECDDILNEVGETKKYSDRIQKALVDLKESDALLKSNENGLKIYSPKYLKLLENLENPDNIGLNLIYTQFRTVEGIAVISLILEKNGYFQFKIKKKGVDDWTIDLSEEQLKSKKLFALFTGDVSEDEREVIRRIYNSEWDSLPKGLVEELKSIHTNNFYGEIIKIFMITSAGAEGINLRNTRFVHIIEPYWHPVRTEQVIGRARRLNSHDDLPKNMQDVEVFIYLMTFTKNQIQNEMAPDIRKNDVSKINNESNPLTSDETLYEISKFKENLVQQILQSVKESAIDCSVHSATSKENIKCFTVDTNNKDEFMFNPNIKLDKTDDVILEEQKLNPKKLVKFQAKKKKIGDTYYAIKKDENGELTNEVYDLDEYIQFSNGELQNPPTKIGNFIIEKGKAKLI